MYINKAFIYGNLTRDPELRAMPSGLNVANFSIATNRTFKDRDGKKQEQTDFHNIVVFGRQADTVAQYLKKGSAAFVEGHIQTRSWEKDGQKMYRTEIVADRVQFGPQRRDRDVVEDHDHDAPTRGANVHNGIEYPKDDINPDDIPF